LAEPVEVALCFDERLALPAAVCVLSALRSNPGRLRLHLWTDPDPPSRRLFRSIAEARGVELHWIEDPGNAAGGFDAASDYGVASTATYRRVFLPRQLPGLERVLYVDADTLIRRDLRPLWDTDLGGAALAAVPDPWMATVPAMHAEFPEGYFNAGVMLLDCARWRREDLTSRCVEEIQHQAALAAQRGEDARHYRNEQTPLNTVVRGRWRAIAPEWNCAPLLTRDVAATIGLDDAAFARVIADPAIVHFLGAHKPWLPGFERMSAWHGEFHGLREEFERAFDCLGLAWPLPFTNGPEAVVRRRAMALRLVSGAMRMGMTEPAVVLTGLLGRDVLEVAREQGLPIAGFVSEYPMLVGHSFQGLPIGSFEEAVRAGQRDFIVADYRRLARTRAVFAHETAGLGVPLRTIDIESVALGQGRGQARRTARQGVAAARFGG
jgi:lipopolysaccharide biosynthesis glycosyltransferase